MTITDPTGPTTDLSVKQYSPPASNSSAGAVLLASSNSDLNTVSVIATATNAVVATITVDEYPVGVAVTPNGAFAYVANSGSNTVSVIATATNAVVATITVGAGPETLAVTPNGDYVYVANFASTVSVIATATNAVVATITVTGFTPQYIAITPNGAFAYLGTSSSVVLRINTATRSWSQIAISAPPNQLVVSPNGDYIYVAEGSQFEVIATATNAVVASVAVSGGTVYGLAFPPVANGGVGSQISLAGPQLSGGTLSGVIAGLVALGLFSS